MRVAVCNQWSSGPKNKQAWLKYEFVLRSESEFIFQFKAHHYTP
jgi:hypothetical protein